MKNIILFLLLLPILVSCTRNSASPSSNSNSEIIPLKVGNSWTYTQINFNQDGTIKDSGSIVETVTSTENVNGNTFFRVTNSFGGDWLFRNADSKTVELSDANGLSIFLKIVDSDSAEYYKGAWHINGCDGTALGFGFTSIYKVNSYDCFKNEHILIDCNGNNDTKYVFYFKPGIGLIRWDEALYKHPSNDLYYYSRLNIRSYNLK
jgi:hypothetical protein